MPIKIAIFASGSGSNAENLANHFRGHHEIQVSKILTNNPKAFVLNRAQQLNIPSQVFAKEEFRSNAFSQGLYEEGVDFIVLAGFLWLVPPHLIATYPNRIINIHPALLPKYGGKGMYGQHVHEAVISQGEHESGITIHLVNEKFDDGRVLFQAKCTVETRDTVASLAKKIHQLEYEHFPQVVENYISQLDREIESRVEV
ncbi:MAG: phosphoribosylglycinamide formyltransferase [Cyclobacteriaceae bacterium]|nr:phosphoribosylglycinamide formyltransferase [Cyclobacteriaceae bacterium HetDA_MAG_MS6]